MLGAHNSISSQLMTMVAAPCRTIGPMSCPMTGVMGSYVNSTLTETRFPGVVLVHDVPDHRPVGSLPGGSQLT
jgi:hypothetical protein